MVFLLCLIFFILKQKINNWHSITNSTLCLNTISICFVLREESGLQLLFLAAYLEKILNNVKHIRAIGNKLTQNLSFLPFPIPPKNCSNIPQLKGNQPQACLMTSPAWDHATVWGGRIEKFSFHYTQWHLLIFLQKAISLGNLGYAI